MKNRQKSYGDGNQVLVEFRGVGEMVGVVTLTRFYTSISEALVVLSCISDCTTLLVLRIFEQSVPLEIWISLLSKDE